MPIHYDATLYPTPRLVIEEIMDRSATFVEQVALGHVHRDNVEEYVGDVWPHMVDQYDDPDAGESELNEADLLTYMQTLLDEEDTTPMISLIIDGESEYDEAEAAEQDRLDANTVNERDHRP